MDQTTASSPGASLVSGLAGAATLTLGHEILRQLAPRSPRMDRLGMVALSRALRGVGISPPRGEQLRGLTMIGDLFGNAIYFAPIVAKSKRPLLRGAVMGALAGAGAVGLTPRLGLPRRHAGLTRRTQLMTVGLYTLGGIAAGAMALYLRGVSRT